MPCLRLIALLSPNRFDKHEPARRLKQQFAAMDYCDLTAFIARRRSGESPAMSRLAAELSFDLHYPR